MHNHGAATYFIKIKIFNINHYFIRLNTSAHTHVHTPNQLAFIKATTRTKTTFISLNHLTNLMELTYDSNQNDVFSRLRADLV